MSYFVQDFPALPASSTTGGFRVTPVSHAWTNAGSYDAFVCVVTVGAYTGTTTITPLGGTAATVANAGVGGAYFVPVGATLTWGVGGSVTTDPSFTGFSTAV